MKITLIITVLMSLCLRVNATTFHILETTNQPPIISAAQGAIVPMLTVLVTANDQRFPPPLFLVVQERGSAPENGNPMTGIYFGTDLKTVSQGPFKFSGFSPRAQALVGPIRLTQGSTSAVVISAQFTSDLSLFHGQQSSLEVVGASVDGYFVEWQDSVTFATPFPIGGRFYTIDTNIAVGTLDIRNTTEFVTVQCSTNPIVLGTFTVSVESEDVTVPYVPIYFSLSNGEVRTIRSVMLTNEAGVQIGNTFDSIRVSEGVAAAHFNVGGKLVIPRGTHRFTVTGIIERSLSVETRITAGLSNFGNANTARGYQLLPTISNANQGVIIRPCVRPTAISISLASEGLPYINILMSGEPNTTYQLEGSSDLRSWTLIETLAMAEGGLRGYKFDTDRSDLKFYRMVRP